MKGKWMGGEGREKGTRRVPRTEGARRAAANVGCNSGKEGAGSPSREVRGGTWQMETSFGGRNRKVARSVCPGGGE